MLEGEEDTKRIFGAGNTMGLFVALYLILLAFFIVLTSVSNQAASRSAVAMQSVNQAFTRTGLSEEEDIDPRAEIRAADDPLLQSIQQAFLSEIELPGRFSEVGGGKFEIQFPESVLFEPGSLQIRQDMVPFLAQIIAILEENGQGGRQEIAFLFGAGEGVINREATRSQELAIRRAGSLSRYLQTTVLEKDVFTTGFVGIPEGQILAIFSKALGKNERNTLSDVKDQNSG